MKEYKKLEHHFPVLLQSVTAGENTARIQTRDHAGLALEICLDWFLGGIVRVRIAYGEFTPPAYAVAREEILKPARIRVERGDTQTRIEGDGCTAVIDASPFAFRLYHTDGTLACEESISDVDSVGEGFDRVPPMGYSLDRGQIKGMNLGFVLHYNESIYGLGEHFTGFDKNGQTVSMRNFDTLGCRDANAYKNIPFYISSYGYGLYVHSHSVFDFHIGAESTATLSAHIPQESLEYYLFVDVSLKKILSRFMKLTGPAALPPKWSFGLWYSTGFQGNSRKHTEEDADRLRKEEIPCDVMHFDCYWMRDDKWCDFVWDDAQYPGRREMLAGLREKGYKICLWINPYVTVTAEMYQEGKMRGYFARNSAGEPYESDLWHGLLSPCVLLDFTNPEAVRWFQGKIAAVLDEGVDVLKTDFGEDIPYDAVFANGMSGLEMRNVYSRLYNQAVFETVRLHKGEENALVWARSGCAGMQQFPVCWSGDPRSCYEGMAGTLRAGLSMAMSGVPFWSHDMGGFYGNVSEEVFVRWSQFGLFTSHSRLHGTTTRQPWAYGGEAKEIVKSFVRLRYSLMPYIWRTAQECAEQGLPFIRPMVLECQDDPTVRQISDQYFFGQDILVAPVFGGHMAKRTVYLPEGEWQELVGEGREFSGGRWYTFECPLSYLPVFKRRGARVETEPVRQYVENAG